MLGSSTGVQQLLYTLAAEGWCGGGWEPATTSTAPASDWREEMAVPETRRSGFKSTAVLLAQGLGDEDSAGPVC